MKLDVVPIRLGGNWVLVRADTVSEFLSATPWVSVPGSSPMLPGVMTWRGRAIPVLDLFRALNFGAIAPLNGCGRVMVLEHELGAVAVPVDGAREVKSLPDGEIRPIHVSTAPYASGEVDEQNTVLPLIEIDQLLRELGRAGT